MSVMPQQRNRPRGQSEGGWNKLQLFIPWSRAIIATVVWLCFLAIFAWLPKNKGGGLVLLTGFVLYWIIILIRPYRNGSEFSVDGEPPAKHFLLHDALGRFSQNQSSRLETFVFQQIQQNWDLSKQIAKVKVEADFYTRGHYETFNTNWKTHRLIEIPIRLGKKLEADDLHWIAENQMMFTFVRINFVLTDLKELPPELLQNQINEMKREFFEHLTLETNRQAIKRRQEYPLDEDTENTDDQTIRGILKTFDTIIRVREKFYIHIKNRAIRSRTLWRVEKCGCLAAYCTLLLMRVLIVLGLGVLACWWGSHLFNGIQINVRLEYKNEQRRGVMRMEQ